MTVRERVRLNPVIHEAFGALRWVGLRDRLRCPKCRAVGTWKPHGGWWDRWHDGDRPARRWMCKWCGYYIGPEGTPAVFPDPARGWWTLPYPLDPDAPPEPGKTPSVVLAEHLGSTWPWRG